MRARVAAAAGRSRPDSACAWPGISGSRVGSVPVGPASASAHEAAPTCFSASPCTDGREQPVDARVVEAAGDRREHRHVRIRRACALSRVIAPPLLAHVAQASSAPRFSHLLRTMRSAKSSMSIFSSWLAAPYSLVITYSDRSTRSTISVSDWPMPAVSTMIRSKPAALYRSITSLQHRGGRQILRAGSPASA